MENSRAETRASDEVEEGWELNHEKQGLVVVIVRDDDTNDTLLLEELKAKNPLKEESIASDNEVKIYLTVIENIFSP